MERKKVSNILFNESEKYVIIVSGETEEEVDGWSNCYRYLNSNYKIVKTITHSNSRHLWVADLLGKHRYNVPGTMIGYSKKEIKTMVATIRSLFKENLYFQIYKLY